MAPVGLVIDNVYITGASLWPNGGSWNPVGTIVSMAMHLADKICESTTKFPSSYIFLLIFIIITKFFILIVIIFLLGSESST